MTTYVFVGAGSMPENQVSACLCPDSNLDHSYVCLLASKTLLLRGRCVREIRVLGMRGLQATFAGTVKVTEPFTY